LIELYQVWRFSDRVPCGKMKSRSMVCPLKMAPVAPAIPATILERVWLIFLACCNPLGNSLLRSDVIPSTSSGQRLSEAFSPERSRRGRIWPAEKTHRHFARRQPLALSEAEGAANRLNCHFDRSERSERSGEICLNRFLDRARNDIDAARNDIFHRLVSNNAKT